MKSLVLDRLATITMFATLSSMGMGAELAFVPAGASSAGGISGVCVVLQPPSIHQLPGQGGTLEPNLKSRFLAVVLNDPGREVAIEVEFVDLAPPYDFWNGYRMYARAPIQICEENTVTIGPCAEDTYATAKLECTSAPVFADFESLGAVNLWHEGIVPESSYSVRVIDSTCDTTLEADFSASTSIQTAM